MKEVPISDNIFNLANFSNVSFKVGLLVALEPKRSILNVAKTDRGHSAFQNLFRFDGFKFFMLRHLLVVKKSFQKRLIPHLSVNFPSAEGVHLEVNRTASQTLRYSSKQGEISRSRKEKLAWFSLSINDFFYRCKYLRALVCFVNRQRVIGAYESIGIRLGSRELSKVVKSNEPPHLRWKLMLKECGFASLPQSCNDHGRHALQGSEDHRRPISFKICCHNIIGYSVKMPLSSDKL